METKNYLFVTTDSSLTRYNGQTVKIKRQMTKELDGIDETDLPKMYKVITDDGSIIEAFEDELTIDNKQ